MKTVVILASLLLATPVAAATIPPLNGKPVVDAANIIPDDREAALTARLFEIKRQSGHEVAVVTVPDLDGEEIEEYSIKAARAYGIGSTDGDDGILFLIAPNQRHDRIEVGDGLQGLLTDAQAGQINRDTVLPMFKAGDYPGGIEQGVEEIAKVITPLTPAQMLVKQREESARKARLAAFAANAKDFALAVGALIASGLGIFGLFKLVTLPKRRRLERERLAAEEAARAKQLREREERQRIVAAEREAQRERDRIQAIEEAKRREEARKREERRLIAAQTARQAKIEEERVKRETMLAAMTPTKRERFLQKERDDAEAERLAQIEKNRLAEIERQRLAAIAAAEAAEQATRDAERRRQESIRRREEDAREEERRAERQRQDDADAQRRRDQESSSASSWGSSGGTSSFDSTPSFGGNDSSFSGGGDTGSW